MRLTPTEDQICKTFAAMVQMHVNVGALHHFDVYHINNGEHSGATAGRANRRANELGQKRGVADYCVCGRHYLEAKSKKGVQTQEQKEFEAYCKSIGARYHVFRDAEEGLWLVLEIKRAELIKI
jgi:hypothetical protein